MSADQRLMNYVQREINTGATTIVIPYELLADATEEVLAEVRALCKISGVTIQVSA